MAYKVGDTVFAKNKNDWRIKTSGIVKRIDKDYLYIEVTVFGNIKYEVGLKKNEWFVKASEWKRKTFEDIENEEMNETMMVDNEILNG